MTCTSGNSGCAACVNNNPTPKSFSALSPQAKAIFLENWKRPVSSQTVLSSTPLHSSSCSTGKDTACSGKSSSLSWRAYLTIGIFAFTVIVSFIGMAFAIRNKSHASKKFSVLQTGKHPKTGALLSPDELANHRKDFYNQVGKD